MMRPVGHYYVTADGKNPQDQPGWVPYLIIGGILGGGMLLVWYLDKSKQPTTQNATIHNSYHM